MSSLEAPARPVVSARSVRRLGDAELPALRALVDADPLVNAVLAARLAAVGSLESRRVGGEVFGVSVGARLVAACFTGGSLLPVGGDPDDWGALADTLARTRRPCTSICGRRAAVSALQLMLAPAWGRPRTVRECQPLLVAARETQSALPADHPGLHRPSPDRFAQYLAASAAMFTEELGRSPLSSAGSSAYRRRVRELLQNSRAFAVTDPGGDVLFKADLGAVTRHTCQVQGVWVRRDLRGRGLATAAMAGVMRQALALAPTVSLYVNDFNLAGRRLYARLGMRQVDELSTVLY